MAMACYIWTSSTFLGSVDYKAYWAFFLTMYTRQVILHCIIFRILCHSGRPVYCMLTATLPFRNFFQCLVIPAFFEVHFLSFKNMFELGVRKGWIELGGVEVLRTLFGSIFWKEWFGLETFFLFLLNSRYV